MIDVGTIGKHIKIPIVFLRKSLGCPCAFALANSILPHSLHISALLLSRPLVVAKLHTSTTPPPLQRLGRCNRARIAPLHTP
jgi:hypothetical protein